MEDSAAVHVLAAAPAADSAEEAVRVQGSEEALEEEAVIIRFPEECIHHLRLRAEVTDLVPLPDRCIMEHHQDITGLAEVLQEDADAPRYLRHL